MIFVAVDFTWLIGGPQGSGVETGANIFSSVCAEMGYHVFGKREFYSNIKGEHSYFAVRVSDKPIFSNVNDVTLITSFDAATIFRHFDEIQSDGAIIYDSDLEDTTTEDVPTLDEPFVQRLLKRLQEHNKPNTIAGALEIAKEKGVKLYPVSFRNILSNLAEETENPKVKSQIRMFNVIGVSLSLGLIRMPTDRLLNSIDSVFERKPKVAELNKQAATHSYNHASAKFADFGYKLEGITKQPGTILVQGHQGTALGKLACGCRFQSYYPITPASDESQYLESNEIISAKEDRPGSIAVIQTEDEISAMGMTIGASLTGTRSSTSTSGPGFSLMAETLGWAGKNEVPIVITLYQRSGPSTGLPTRHGQDDLSFAINAGHGEFPKIVYASGDIEESFYDTARCFNYSEVYQIPVIHMMDKFLASSVVTCKSFDPTQITINRGKLLTQIESDDYKRFQFTDDGISPRSRLGLKNGIFWNTGDESDENGHITEDPVIRAKMMEKRLSRLDLVLHEIPKDEQLRLFSADSQDNIFTIISWGSGKGPILDAIEMLKKDGINNIQFVQIKLLHPFPKDHLEPIVKNSEKIIDIEANYTGQLGKLFKEYIGIEPDHYILKYTGRGVTSTEIYETLKKIVDGGADKREVLMHGA